jgi:glycosyltransferase involved in cell wall biosynthesis
MSTVTAPKISFVVLTLNEIDGVRAIMPQVDHSLFDQIIILDGGSTDGTREWARENGYELYVQKRRGIRFAYFEVLDKIKGDMIVTFSPDGNCKPEHLAELVAKMKEGYDLIIVSRYLAHATSHDDDLITSFGNWLFTKTINILHGGHYTDAMNIYRAYWKHTIYDLDLDKDEGYALPERLFRTVISWEPLMAVRAAKRKLRITEIPGDEPARIGGHRKLQIWRWGAAYYFQFFRELFFWR